MCQAPGASLSVHHLDVLRIYHSIPDTVNPRQHTQAADIPLSLLGPGLGYKCLIQRKDTLAKEHTAPQQKMLVSGQKKFFKIILTFGKEQIAEWAHHQAHKAREHASPWEEGWKLRGMP